MRNSSFYLGHVNQNNPYWQLVRQKVKDRERGLCQDCGKPGRDVHHTQYGHVLGDELNHLDTLEYLCRSCHDRRHFRTEDSGLTWAELKRMVQRMGTK